MANNESDEKIADAFRALGVQTKNDNSEFLAKFAKLMFGPLQSCHLDHAWHKRLHNQDEIKHFPTQLTMVYRTSMLLRGLAVSLQFNVSVGDLWKAHAEEAINRYEIHVEESIALVPQKESPILRRLSAKDVVEELQELTEELQQDLAAKSK